MTLLDDILDRQANNHRRQFAGLLVEALADYRDVEVKAAYLDKRGPLGGTSQQVHLVFTDLNGDEHGVIVNAYVGEPDVYLIGDTVEGHGR